MVKEQEKAIIGAYPNTYTFTKALAERMIKKLHGNLPTVIVRPSIVTSTYEDPFRGWTDTIAASGFQSMMVMNGLLHFVRTNKETVLDLIPCDFVSNQILVQTVYSAKQNIPRLIVVHATTSARNPVKLTRMMSNATEIARYTQFYAKPPNSKVWVYPVESLRLWKFLMYMSMEFPLLILEAKHRVSGNELKMMKAAKTRLFAQRTINTYAGFDYFTSHTWSYLSNLSQQAWNMMSVEEQKEFNLDVTTIDNDLARSDFIFGIRRFFFKEDVLPPESQFQQLLAKDQIEFFHDAKIAY